MEKYSRGRRGAPAKGVGRATGARVQIPLSPFTLPVLSRASIDALDFFITKYEHAEEKNMDNLRLKVGSFFIGISIVVGAMNLQGGIASMRPPVDLYDEETNINEIEYFDLVEADIEVVLDQYATQTNRVSRRSSQKITRYYYILPVQGESEDEVYYIGIEVPEESVATYNELVDNTGVRSVHVQGCITNMWSYQYDLFKNWFAESGWFDSDEDIEKYALKRCFVPMNPDMCRQRLMAGGICLGLGILLVVIDRVCSKKQQKPRKRTRKEIKAQQVIIIDGVGYSKESMKIVDKYVSKRKKKKAINELCKITGIESIDAQIIINNWSSYYYK